MIYFAVPAGNQDSPWRVQVDRKSMLVKKPKRIFVYMEDTPVHPDVVAHGLHRAGPPILRSILDHIDGISINPVGRRYARGDLDQVLAPLCVILPRLPTIVCKAFRRFPAFDFGVANAIPPRLLAPRLRRSSADILLVFVGADAGTLTRATRLATLTGKSCVFYVVDDFLSSLRISGASEKDLQTARESATTALRSAKHIFTITDGLGEHLRKSYGLSTTTLRLAFEPEPRPILPAKSQIIYVGSINFLYAEGLRDLFKAVERVRRTSGVDLTMRLTVSAELAARELGRLPSFVVSAPVDASEGLAMEVASSLFAFLPYSFNPREYSMVSTSFPSKSMEYLAYARSIVVYGPDYGVTTRLFREKGLPSVVSTPTELDEVLQSHLAIRPDNSAAYRGYLAMAHSLAAARKTLCHELGLDAG